MRKLLVPVVLLAGGVALLAVWLPGRDGEPGRSDLAGADAGRTPDVMPTLTASGAKRPASAEDRAELALAEQIAALVSADAAAARSALEGLRQAMGEKRLSLEQMLRIALLEGLDGDAETFRVRVAHHLWNQGDYRDTTPLFDPLLALCLDPDAPRKAWCVEMLRRVVRVLDRAMESAADEGLDLPARSLGEADFERIAGIVRTPGAPVHVRALPLTQLHWLGPRATELIPAVVSMLRELRQVLEAVPGGDGGEAAGRIRDSMDHLGENMVLGLARLEPPALETLFELFQASDQAWAEEAQRALGRVGEATLPGLLEAAQHADPRIRQRATHALCDGDFDEEVVLVALRARLEDAEADVRAEAARNLLSVGELATQDVLQVLRGKDPIARFALLDYFFIYWDDFPEGVLQTVLEQLRGSEDEGEQAILLELADELHEKAVAETVPILRALVAGGLEFHDDPQPAELIFRLGSGAGRLLLPLLSDPDPGMRGAAARALHWAEKPDAATLEAAGFWLDAHPTDPDRYFIASMLAAAGRRDMLRHLSDGLDTKDWEVRVACADGLANLMEAGAPYLGRVADLVAALAKEIESRPLPRTDWMLTLLFDAKSSLEYLGAYDREAMYDLLGHPVEEVADAARSVFTDARFEGVALLCRRWGQASATQRAITLRLLAAGGSLHNPRVTEILIEALRSEVAAERVAGAAALLSTAPDAEMGRETAEALVSVYVNTGASGRARHDARRALVGVTRDWGKALVLAALRKHETHEDAEMRRRVRSVIAEIEDG